MKTKEDLEKQLHEFDNDELIYLFKKMSKKFVQAKLHADKLAEALEKCVDDYLCRKLTLGWHDLQSKDNQRAIAEYRKAYPKEKK